MSKNRIIGIIATVIGAVCSVLSLVYLIKSFGAENYGSGYGMEFWSNPDYIMFLIVSVATLLFGIYYIVKDKDNVIDSLSLLCIFNGIMLGCYSWGRFFRQLAKHKGFSGWYFTFALIGLAVLAVGIVVKFVFVKKNK